LSDIRILATTISDWFKRFEDWSAIREDLHCIYIAI
jgi:hypothetical protein